MAIDPSADLCIDVAETISEFYSRATSVQPPAKTVLSNYDVDQYLHQLGQLTREQDQLELMRKITAKSTVNDLRMFIRLVQKDLVKPTGLFLTPHSVLRSRAS